MVSRSPLPKTVLALSALSLLLLSAGTASAQDPEPGFPDRTPLRLELPQFTNAELARLTGTLDRLMTPPVGPGEAGATLWNFGRQLQSGRMTTAQEVRVLAHLDRLARAQPEHTGAVATAKKMITTLRPGKSAPDIVGRDLDGAELRLKDYRGKVVVLLFSADWCGICKTLDPYERLMQELYKNWPFAMVSVESGATAADAKRSKAQRGLSYRSWWDGSEEEGQGPIAAAWNVGGLPTLYVIDADGVIRFVDVRYEDLLKAVRQLLDETPIPVQTSAQARPRP
jgi:peroxiredoxin